VAELKAADTLVIGLPIYNFGVPAALKAWVDQVARAGVTFKYSEYGPKGLLEGKRAIVAVASGGTEAGSDIDFATGYIRHVLGFIGITDVEFVTADRLMLDADGTMAKASNRSRRFPRRPDGGCTGDPCGGRIAHPTCVRGAPVKRQRVAGDRPPPPRPPLSQRAQPVILRNP
jgi:hypothetical protein